MADIIRIILREQLTHDVIRIVTSKPVGVSYQPGQAADISLNLPGWEQELRAFTFTSLPEDVHLEFTIKTYPSRNGVTNQLLSLDKGGELILHGVFGDISYQGEGMFIAGGAGVTPFIAILKYLARKKAVGNNKLIFANKIRADIILKNEFQMLLGANFINILSREKCTEHEYGFITAELIERHMDKQTKYFYVCGPDPMMEAAEQHLATLGISGDFIIRESF